MFSLIQFKLNAVQKLAGGNDLLPSGVKDILGSGGNDMLASFLPPPFAGLVHIMSKKPCKAPYHKKQEVVIRAEPIKESLEMVVNHKDGRKKVQGPSKWPNSAHGVITVKFAGMKGTCYGTGTLIGPDLVLTAGHNLYNREKKAYAQLESIQFVPGMGGKKAPFGIIEVEKYFVSPNYVKYDREDYAILILKEPVGEMTGHFGVICPDPVGITEKTITVTGYPRDKVESKPQTYEMWEMEGSVVYVDEEKGLIHYQIDTAGGQSGSGVWYREGEGYYVCGIHIGGNYAFNQATLLTEGIYQQIRAWYKEHQSKMKCSILEKRILSGVV